MNWQGGLTRLEFSVTVAVIGAIATVFLAKVLEAQELGERAKVEATVRNVQAGLRWAMAEALMRGEEDRVAELPGSNPVRWLERPPAGYLGEFDGVSAAASSGAWYFDRRRAELAYRPRLDRHLAIEDGGGELRWRIAPGKGAGQPALRGGASPVVVTTTPHRWF
ncbi:MAG: hypothetical protein OHM77_10900 [Candidatus Nitricoxidivorans perseverans]|uniref:Type II secretion system protein n=1 Tax=Candidatus Nitricoxidivorans perseverans TaxID=2975601 RepID=A0AA49FJJ3_9PROT|nr:MAG: hypothetical protein OHM77_10900 [Candidatus Nitricoxidivorans perseverans]